MAFKVKNFALFGVPFGFYIGGVLIFSAVVILTVLATQWNAIKDQVQQEVDEATDRLRNGVGRMTQAAETAASTGALLRVVDDS